LSEIRRWALF